MTFKCQKCSTAEYRRDGALSVLSAQSEKEVTQQNERWWKIGDILKNAQHPLSPKNANHAAETPLFQIGAQTAVAKKPLNAFSKAFGQFPAVLRQIKTGVRTLDVRNNI